MDSDRLKYFLSAAQCLNFSEVARANFVSQPTVSHQISLLEQELDAELFFRQGKTLRLSKEGEYFIPLATRILADIKDASLDLTRFKHGKMGRVSILVSETCRTAYQRCLVEFSMRYPDILLDADVTFRGTMHDNLIHGNYDIFFTPEKVAKNSEQFEYVITHSDKLCLVVPENFPLPDDIDDFSGLKNIPFVGMSTTSPMMQSDLERIFLLRGYRPQIINRCNRLEDALLSVEAGIGFSILPLSIVLFYGGKRVKYLPFEDSELYVNCVAAWRRKVRSKQCDAFVEVVKDIFAEK